MALNPNQASLMEASGKPFASAGSDASTLISSSSNLLQLLNDSALIQKDKKLQLKSFNENISSSPQSPNKYNSGACGNFAALFRNYGINSHFRNLSLEIPNHPLNEAGSSDDPPSRTSSLQQADSQAYSPSHSELTPSSIVYKGSSNEPSPSSLLSSPSKSPLSIFHDMGKWKTGSGPYACSVCGMRFPTRQALGGHSNAHKGLQGPSHPNLRASSGRKRSHSKLSAVSSAVSSPKSTRTVRNSFPVSPIAEKAAESPLRESDDRAPSKMLKVENHRRSLSDMGPFGSLADKLNGLTSFNREPKQAKVEPLEPATCQPSNTLYSSVHDWVKAQIQKENVVATMASPAESQPSFHRTNSFDSSSNTAGLKLVSQLLAYQVLNQSPESSMALRNILLNFPSLLCNEADKKLSEKLPSLEKSVLEQLLATRVESSRSFPRTSSEITSASDGLREDVHDDIDLDLKL